MIVALLTFPELLELGEPLFPLHHREVGRGELHVNRAFFDSLEASGALICLGLFDGSTMVGYSIAAIGSHPFSTEVYCHSLAIFVPEEHRAGGNGAALMRRTEIEAADKGATRMFWPAPLGSRIDAILSATSATPIETVYARKL